MACTALNAWDPPQWGPNLEEFRKRFDPEPSYGEGAKRLKNLYFTFLVELRALTKVAPYLDVVSLYYSYQSYRQCCTNFRSLLQSVIFDSCKL